MNSSQWYDTLFENWLYWYEKLALDMQVILVPEDRFTMNKYSNHPKLMLASMGFVDANEVSLFSTSPKHLGFFGSRGGSSPSSARLGSA